ncbi:MAG: hypothetical protein KGH61_02900 [Candidatus Micrarchaeota archaeon]|nr:hypothetical protein [Candidatus Micrarchaeota archaeon]MDE1847872.1 hypothetical protein [Candidatus Micrarchaeota archaeon]
MKIGNDFSELERHDNPVCPECKKGRLVDDPDSGEIHCRSCGFVSKEKTQVVDVSISKDLFRSTPKTGTSKDNPVLIDPINKDFYGRSISPAMVESMNRLRTWDLRSHAKPGRDRNLSKALPKIFTWSRSLSIGDNAANNAASIYQKAIAFKLTRGRSMEEMAAGAVLSSCKINGIPRSDKQIAQIAGLKLKGVRRAYRLIFMSLGLSADVADPKVFVPPIASKINLEPRVIRLAGKILDEVSTADIRIGKNPMAQASAALYLSCVKFKVDVTQNSISSASDISGVTIRRTSHLINEILKQPIPISVGPKKANSLPGSGVKGAIRDRQHPNATKIH